MGEEIFRMFLFAHEVVIDLSRGQYEGSIFNRYYTEV